MRNKRDLKSPDPNELCPCDSGELYGRCCAGRKLRWSREADGTWTRSVLLHPEAMKILRAQEREFVELFGREPADDPVFFEINALYSEESINDDMNEALAKSDIRPEIAYAIQKTGLIVTADNESLLTGRDLREWDDAIDEYHRTKNLPKTAQEKKLERLITLIISEFDRCMVVMGLVLQRGGPVRASDAHGLAAGHSLFCLTKSVKSMRAVHLLTDKGFGEDSLVLIRSILESYLHAAFLVAHPEKAADLVIARVGLTTGTHEYRVTPKGSIDYGCIVEKKSGQTFEGRISFKTMANQSFISEDGSVYEALYEFLSGYTHPNFAHATTYVSLEKSSYQHTGKALFIEARALGFVIGSMFLHLVFESNYLSDKMTQDLRFYLCRTRRKLLTLLKSEFPSALVAPLRARVERLPRM